MRIISYMFIFLCCFPYIQFFNVGTNSDIQMYSILLAAPIVILHILKDEEIPKFIAAYGYYFICVVMFLMLYSIVDGTSSAFTLFRGLASYIFFVFIPIATYYALKYISLETLGAFIKYCYWIWIGVGICQLVYPAFMTDWIRRTVLTSDRGVISLSSEPAYFSITLIILTLILLMIDLEKNALYKYVTFLATVLLANSAVGLIYSTILILLLWKKDNDLVKKIFLWVAAIMLIIIIAAVYIELKPQSRLTMLITNMLVDPYAVVMSDYSLNDRFANIYISFKYFFTDFFMPHGITSWGEIHVKELMNNRIFIYWGDISGWIDDHGIATMIGAMLFECGILAIPYFAFIYRIFSSLNYGKAVLILLLILGINGLNMTNPTFLLLIGVGLYKMLTTEAAEVSSIPELTKGDFGLYAKTD